MQWIEEILTKLRTGWKKTEGRVDPKNTDVAYWFLHEGEWCNTFMGNIDVEWANKELVKQNHPERYFELMNQWYTYIDYDSKLIKARRIRNQLYPKYKPDEIAVYYIPKGAAPWIIQK